MKFIITREQWGKPDEVYRIYTKVMEFILFQNKKAQFHMT